MVFQDVIFYVLAVASVVAALGVVLLRDIFRAALLLVVVFLAVAGFFVMLNAEFLAVAQVLIYAGAIAILIIFAIMLTREVQQGNLPNRLQPAAVLFPALLLAALVFVAFDTDWNLLSKQDAQVQSDVAIVQTNTLGGVPSWIGKLEQDKREAEERAIEEGERGEFDKAEELEQEAEATGNEITRLKSIIHPNEDERELSTGIGDLLINEYVLPFEIASVLLLAAVIGALVLVRER